MDRQTSLSCFAHLTPAPFQTQQVFGGNSVSSHLQRAPFATLPLLTATSQGWVWKQNSLYEKTAENPWKCQAAEATAAPALKRRRRNLHPTAEAWRSLLPVLHEHQGARCTHWSTQCHRATSLPTQLGDHSWRGCRAATTPGQTLHHAQLLEEGPAWPCCPPPRGEEGVNPYLPGESQHRQSWPGRRGRISQYWVDLLVSLGLWHTELVVSEQRPCG